MFINSSYSLFILPTMPASLGVQVSVSRPATRHAGESQHPVKKTTPYKHALECSNPGEGLFDWISVLWSVNGTSLCHFSGQARNDGYRNTLFSSVFSVPSVAVYFFPLCPLWLTSSVAVKSQLPSGRLAPRFRRRPVSGKRANL